MPPAQPGTNGFSIASLVAGILCCLPPLGLILGVVALVQIRRKGQSGKGMAIAGTVLSSLSTLLMVLLLVTGGAAEMWRGFQDGVEEASRTRDTLELREGQCFNLPGDGPMDEAYSSSVEVVPCVERHEAEVTGTFRLMGYDRFPGDDWIEPLAEQRCEEINGMYARDEWLVLDRGLELYYYSPTKESWELGDSTVTCTLATSDGKRNAGSVKRTTGSLDTLQLAYLTTETKASLTGSTLPVEDWPRGRHASQTWARESAVVFKDQVEVLRTYSWPARLRGPVERRAREFERARAALEKAAATRDEDVFWDQVLTVDDILLDGPTEVEIRRLLKLPFVPPERPEE
ncbi:DUF4190 domain-containing protein [Streptomyces yaizuensis]|uniref:DUF4190 domain-containing protein n=1 Tax=Streptomyces yaizuensis TaxID=2989713 RepID=A0ABQ5NVP6_9ACTN|nr:DUF4190 domain-containing protein [Streptomyces sp. YSPA8]GLF94439.1 DUF4190 domain-containing protein [Streptomyces sp. YSPA8]